MPTGSIVYRYESAIAIQSLHPQWNENLGFAPDYRRGTNAELTTTLTDLAQ